MIRKLLCWLGWHKWRKRCDLFKYWKDCNWFRNDRNGCNSFCHHLTRECKHCGKVKKFERTVFSYLKCLFV